MEGGQLSVVKKPNQDNIIQTQHSLHFSFAPDELPDTPILDTPGSRAPASRATRTIAVASGKVH